MYSDSEASKGKFSENNKGKKLYIGNLPFSVDDNSLRNFFEAALGPKTVQTAQVVMDRIKERSKGFGFVVFVSDDIAMKAIALNGQEIQGPDGVARKISLDEARERTPRIGGSNNYARGPRNFGGNDRNLGGNNDFGGGGFIENDGGGWGRKDNNRRGRGNKKHDSSDRW